MWESKQITQTLLSNLRGNYYYSSVTSSCPGHSFGSFPKFQMERRYCGESQYDKCSTKKHGREDRLPEMSLIPPFGFKASCFSSLTKGNEEAEECLKLLIIPRSLDIETKEINLYFRIKRKHVVSLQPTQPSWR